MFIELFDNPVIDCHMTKPNLPPWLGSLRPGEGVNVAELFKGSVAQRGWVGIDIGIYWGFTLWSTFT